jgi:hypothetical protein
MSHDAEELFAEMFRGFTLVGLLVIVPIIMIFALMDAEEVNFNKGSCQASCKTHGTMKEITSLPTCICIDGSAHVIRRL